MQAGVLRLNKLEASCLFDWLRLHGRPGVHGGQPLVGLEGGPPLVLVPLLYARVKPLDG